MARRSARYYRCKASGCSEVRRFDLGAQVDQRHRLLSLSRGPPPGVHAAVTPLSPHCADLGSTPAGERRCSSRARVAPTRRAVTAPDARRIQDGAHVLARQAGPILMRRSSRLLRADLAEEVGPSKLKTLRAEIDDREGPARSGRPPGRWSGLRREDRVVLALLLEDDVGVVTWLPPGCGGRVPSAALLGTRDSRAGHRDGGLHASDSESGCHVLGWSAPESGFIHDGLLTSVHDVRLDQSGTTTSGSDEIRFSGSGVGGCPRWGDWSAWSAERVPSRSNRDARDWGRADEARRGDATSCCFLAGRLNLKTG